MKSLKIIILLVSSFVGSQLSAQQTQEAQEILGIAKEYKDAHYYKTQAHLWKAKTQSTPKNGNAWLNYYKAQRAYYQQSDYDLWVRDQEGVFKKLVPIISEVGKHMPNSFEYNYLQSFNTIDDEKSLRFLLMAYKIDPKRKETYEGLLTEYMVRWDEDKATEIAKRIMSSNIFSNPIYMWNNNILQSATKNSIIFSCGDMDTLPRWVLQRARGTRTDVTVINQPLMANSPTYLAGTFKKLNIQPYGKSKKDFPNTEDYKNELLKYIIKQCSARKSIHFDCGVDIKLFSKLGIKSKMYLTGLSFTYSEQPIDNMAITKKNFEQVMNLEYITTDFQVHPQDGIVKKSMNISYIPGLMKLKNHYVQAGESNKAAKYTALMNYIANESGRREEILGWYGKKSF